MPDKKINLGGSPSHFDIHYADYEVEFIIHVLRKHAVTGDTKADRIKASRLADAMQKDLDTVPLGGGLCEVQKG